MVYKYGIDFGTTNSSIAFRFLGDDSQEHTWVVDVKDVYPRETLPSLLWIDDKGNIKVGNEAVRQYTINANKPNFKQRLIRKIKMDLEEKGSSLTYKVGNKSYSVIVLIAAILKELRLKADRCTEEADIDPQGVVMGVPVQYGDIQKNVLKKALVEAGFYSNEREAELYTEFVSEPIAVAVHYGLNLETNKNVLVFDFGGGTLDVAVVNLKKQVGTDKLHPHETIAKERLTLGGEELTRQFFINSFCNKSKYGANIISKAFRIKKRLSPEELWEYISNSEFGAEFISKIEDCKCQLSERKMTQFSYLGPNGIVLDEKVFYREDFEDAISEALDAIDELIQSTIDNCVQTGNIDDEMDIDHVIVAGGSSLIPGVQDILYDTFGKMRVIAKRFDNDKVIEKYKRKKISESEVLTSIVRGLAAVGCRDQALVEDVVDSSYGVWDDGEDCFLPIINAGVKVKDTIVDKLTNSGIYQEVKCTDYTASSVEVKIYQSNDKMQAKLGTIIIKHPGGKKYKIFMQVDSKKGSLEVLFYDCVSHRWMEDIPLDERSYSLK